MILTEKNPSYPKVERLSCFRFKQGTKYRLHVELSPENDFVLLSLEIELVRGLTLRFKFLEPIERAIWNHTGCPLSLTQIQTWFARNLRFTVGRSATHKYLIATANLSPFFLEKSFYRINPDTWNLVQESIIDES